MLKKSSLLFITAFLTTGPCFSYSALETEDFSFSVDVYLRQDLVTFKNVVDLDSANSDDTTTYLGIDYGFGFHFKPKNEWPEFYLRLERNGPYDYDAPLLIHNTLITSGGRIEAYRNEQLLPQLEEFWLDAPLINDIRIKPGLYTYTVGNGFSLNGAYENYGLAIYRDTPGISLRLYYCRPDLVHKNQLGPHISQEEGPGDLL